MERKEQERAAAEAEAEEERPREGGPLLGLLARGLELWLRQQCEAIGELEIRLEGSAAELLRGSLAGVGLRARRVVYQELEIERVELRSAPIRVRMGPLLRRRTLELAHPFEVSGRVAFSGEGLTRSLAGPRWRDLGDDLARRLLGPAVLEALILEADRVLLQGRETAPDPAGPSAPLERAARLVAVPAGLEVHPLDGAPPLTIPIDPDIRLARADVADGLLELTGEALVQP
jgi:hypothetical protein